MMTLDIPLKVQVLKQTLINLLISHQLAFYGYKINKTLWRLRE